MRNDAFIQGDVKTNETPANTPVILELSPREEEFGRIRNVILESPLPRPLTRSLCVAAEEIFLNICSYAFSEPGLPGPGKVRFTFLLSDRIRMVFEDNGTAYDPTKGVPDDPDYDPDLQLGGLGRIIAFTIADSVFYEYKDHQNILTITKNFEGE